MCLRRVTHACPNLHNPVALHDINKAIHLLGHDPDGLGVGFKVLVENLDILGESLKVLVENLDVLLESFDRMAELNYHASERSAPRHLGRR